MNEYLQEEVKTKASAELRVIAKRELKEDKNTSLYHVFTAFKIAEYIIYWARDNEKQAFLSNKFNLLNIAMNAELDEILSDYDKENIKDCINDFINDFIK